MDQIKSTGTPALPRFLTCWPLQHLRISSLKYVTVRWFSVLSVLKVAFHTQTIKYEMCYENSRMGLSPLLTLAENTKLAGTGPKQLLMHSKDRRLCVWRTEASRSEEGVSILNVANPQDSGWCWTWGWCWTRGQRRKSSEVDSVAAEGF